MDFLSKEIKVDKDEDRYIRLQLWDSAGQEKFCNFHHSLTLEIQQHFSFLFLNIGPLTSSYAKDCDVAVIMYDVTNQKSFDSTTRWASEAKKEAQRYREREALLVLAGNKTDLEDERVINTQEGEIRARELGAAFFEVSATSFESVKRIFDYIQGYLVPSKDKVPISPRAGVAGKTFQPGDFEIDITRDPDDINSVPPARALMPTQGVFNESYYNDDGGDNGSGNGKNKNKNKKGGFSCCPCCILM